ncbi:MAG TPA: hypothetical protein VFV85_08260 [Conexibacter sp.]|nr:hypothetical protein [Conexibacter sp.]
MRPRFRLLAVALPLLLLGAAPAAHASGNLGSAPAACTIGPDPSCLVRGGGGDVTVSPRIVQVGHDFTVKLTDTGDYGGPASWGLPGIDAVGAGITAGYKLVKPGCVGRKTHKQGDQWTASEGLAGSFTCHYKATSTGRGWQKATVSFNVRYGGLASYSEDAFHVVGDKSAYLEGYVRGLPSAKGAKGPGIRGMHVKAAGPDGGIARTNGDGYYSIEIGKPGRYEVAGELRDGDRKARPRPHLDPGSRRVRLKRGDHLKDVNFKLTRGDAFDVDYTLGGKTISSVPADGVSGVTATIHARDPNGDPLSGRQLELVVDGARLAPKAIVCSGGQRLWPSGIVAGQRSAQVDPRAQLQTDSAGTLTVQVYPGTEPGRFELTVRDRGAPKDGPDATEPLTLARESGADLSAAVKGAIVAGVPGAGAPLAGSVSPAPSGAVGDLYNWLIAAKKAGMLRGWDFAPVEQQDAPVLAKYGIAFWRSGSPPPYSGSVGTRTLLGGQIYDANGNGLNPLRDGQPLQSLADWSGGLPAIVHMFQPGYNGDDLHYLGWPYEQSPAAQTCIAGGP